MPRPMTRYIDVYIYMSHRDASKCCCLFPCFSLRSSFLLFFLFFSCFPFFIIPFRMWPSFYVGKIRKTKLSNKKKVIRKKKSVTVYQEKKKRNNGVTRSTVLHAGRRDPPSILVKKKTPFLFPHSFCLPLCYPTRSHPNCKGLLSP